ncbi:TPA: transglycosylase SLT domain-containing protein [Klebsiella variicola subsp. variicola]|uniref:transglycosylase SLT domain-containing protein n=1 Tax=Klebsiella variicola TaxID=244366 RepID=UPI0018AD3867|nr:transglycosylase SLT domain-containing protein [Klebsiella variicola]HBQ8853208.1 transglycosylase SLT domain-containing protein [Klebsiella variicola subsp. variicola]MEC5997204.1 transglycosylase SLT domain-containing protein [Klebsiella variicola]QPJ04237.1 transglycosylase SLT domain-containing protein [Klebsiella variicola]HBQ8859776.1 transglycosylase SLT domain-containing protein [Klebsiella variicola subsp. variicola]HBQ8886396.1 transglycosylase SLT domain-containing protein [Klebs
MPNLPFYDRQVTTQGLGAGPINLPTTSSDQQFLGAGTEAAARAAETITRQENDTAMQGAAFGLDAIKYGLFKQVREKQGAAALDSSNQALQQFDQEAEKLNQNIPTSRRDEWERLKMATRLQLQSSADAHEFDEMKRYHQGQFEGRLDLGIADAQTYWKEPILYNTAVEKVDNAIDTYSAANGWSAEQTAAMKKDTQQKMALSATQANIAERTKGMMNADGTLNAYDGTIDPDQLATAAFYQESRLSQFDASGQPLTSKKGAVGIAQVMKDTGPEAARAAGLPWDEERWRNDPAYNLALGKAYLNKQLKAFGGNNVLALAAYNAGPGKVNEWISKYGDPRTGAITNEDFIRSIPFQETQSYVTKIMDSVPSVPKTATMAAITDTPYFHQLSPQAQSSALSGMAEILNKQRQASRVVLDGVVNDASAALRNGQQPQVMPSRNQLISTYGLVQGGQLYTQLQNDEAFGNNVKLVKNIPPAQQQQLLEQAKPETGPNYAERLKNYEQLQSAISAVNSARNADPVAFGIKEGAVGQIDFTDLNSLQSSMQARAVQAGRISQQYGTPPTLLTKAEAKQFSTMLSQSAPGDALTLLQAVGRSLPPQGVSMFQAQLGENNPTYGALAGILAAPDNLNTRSVVGSHVDNPLTVDKYIASERILQGYRALSPSAQDKKSGVTPITIPSDQKMQESFNDLAGDAFPMSSQERQRAYGLFKSAYAGELLNNPDLDSGDRADAAKSIDDKIAKKAILYATGGVLKYRGTDVVAPYGMGEDDFKLKMDNARAEAFKGLGSPSNFAPVKLPSGRYGFRIGNRLATKDGQVITVEIN